MTRNEPGGHDVVVVNDLDEGLDTRTLGNTLLAHGFGDFQWVFFNTSDNAVGVRTLFGAFVKVLDNHGLFASESAVQ